MPSAADIQNWVGREQTKRDTVTRVPLDGLASLLDCPAFEGVLPLLAQWLYFLPHTRQSHLAADGHPIGSDLLPAIPYPRRMWAGGAVEFLHEIPIGAGMTRLTRVASIESKTGRSGPMIFITLLHEISSNGVVAIQETQDLVYKPAILRAPATVLPVAPIPNGQSAESEQNLTVDTVALFRFSALTFNAHRIHYDREYARDIEGYPGLVVHGPYLAMLLMQFIRNSFPNVKPLVLRYRSIRPVFDGEPFKLLGTTSPDGVKLWITDLNGYLAMAADVSAT